VSIPRGKIGSGVSYFSTSDAGELVGYRVGFVRLILGETILLGGAREGGREGGEGRIAWEEVMKQGWVRFAQGGGASIPGSERVRGF